MKQEDLMTALGLVNERFIAEAEQLAQTHTINQETDSEWVEIPLERTNTMTTKRQLWKKIAAGTAVAAAIGGIVLGSGYWRHDQNSMPNADSQTGNLPGIPSESSQQTDDSSQSGYVDLEDEKDKIENLPTVLDVQFDGYTAHEKPWSMFEFQYTLDENYLYLWDGERRNAYSSTLKSFKARSIKFNLKTGRLEYLCETPGCAHDLNLSPDCANQKNHFYDYITRDGLYMVIKDTLWLVTGDLSGDEKTKIWTNTFYTDYCKEVAPDYSNGFNFIIRGDILHLFCYNWYYSVNLLTLEQTEPIVVSDSQIVALDVCGDYLWYATQDWELFCWQLSTGEKKKIADMALRVACIGDKVYYARGGQQDGTLTRCNPDGSDPQLLLEHISNSFYVTEQSIYYTNGAQNPKQGAFRCDLDGQNVREIKLELKYTASDAYQPNEVYMGQFVSDPTCNYIFLLDRGNSESALFAIPKDSTEAVGFSLYS